MGGVWSALVSAAQGNTYFHLWILYPLIGLYLVHPLLQRFASSASRGEILYILGLAFLFASVLPLWAAFHPNQVLTALLERFRESDLPFDNVLVRKVVDTVRVESAEKLEITFKDGNRRVVEHPGRN